MAELTILRYPDLRLTRVARPVEAVDARIQALVADMLDTKIGRASCREKV